MQSREWEEMVSAGGVYESSPLRRDRSLGSPCFHFFFKKNKKFMTHHSLLLCWNHMQTPTAQQPESVLLSSQESGIEVTEDSLGLDEGEPKSVCEKLAL